MVKPYSSIPTTYFLDISFANHTIYTRHTAFWRKTHVTLFYHVLGNPRNFKHKKGENLMSWTQLDAKEVRFEFAVGQGANINGFYKGFQIEYAVVSDLTHESLKAQIDAFLTNQDN